MRRRSASGYALALYALVIAGGGIALANRRSGLRRFLPRAPGTQRQTSSVAPIRARSPSRPTIALPGGGRIAAEEFPALFKEEGFELASTTGKATGVIYPSGFGLLDPKDTRTVRVPLLPFLARKVQARAFVATVWTDNAEPRGAIPDQRWVIEVHGEDQLAKLEPVAERLRRRLGIRIDLRVVERAGEREDVEPPWAAWERHGFGSLPGL